MTEIFVYEKEMPKSCCDCPLLDEYLDFPNVFCRFNDEIVNDGEEISENRHTKCPLKILKSD